MEGKSVGRKFTVLVVDDDALAREAFRAFFRNQERFVQVGEARDGLGAVQGYEKLKPDVVLMDLQMPVLSGIDATSEIVRRWPDACVVALTTFGGPEHVVPALKAGASGYLLKDAGSRAVIGGLTAALNGEMPLSPSVRQALVRAVTATTPTPKPVGVDVSVTPRERELLGWLAHGMSNAEIAERMHVSDGSVKQYLNHIGNKLAAKSRTQILIKSIQLGLVDPMRLPHL